MRNSSRSVGFVLSVALVATIAGCGKKGDDGKGGAGGSGSTSATTAQKKSLKDLFTTKKPAQIGPLAQVKLGSTEAEAKKAAPKLMELGGVQSDIDNVWFSVFAMDDKVMYETMSMPKVGALDTVKAAWGEPVKGKDEIMNAPQYYWFNPEDGIRAKLGDSLDKDSMQLQIDAYQPVAKQIGDSGPPFAFEKKKALLGATPDEIKKAYGDLAKSTGGDGTDIHLELPPNEYGSFNTWVSLMFDAGKVTQYTIKFDYGPYPAFKDDALKQIKKQLGEPKMEKDFLDKPVMAFKDSPKVILSDDDISKAWSLEVSKPEAAPGYDK